MDSFNNVFNAISSRKGVAITGLPNSGKETSMTMAREFLGNYHSTPVLSTRIYIKALAPAILFGSYSPKKDDGAIAYRLKRLIKQRSAYEGQIDSNGFKQKA